MYGTSNYDIMGVVDTSSCSNCNSDCHECKDSTSGHCLSCNTGKYLQRVANGAEYHTWGSCVSKD